MFLFSFIIGRKSGEYQAEVLIIFARQAQPLLNGVIHERRKMETRMSARIKTIVAAALVASALAAAPAQAEDGVWKVGQGYVIRFERLDLSRAIDRQVLLAQVEHAAKKVCKGQRPANRRDACAADTLRSIKESAGPSLSATLDVARFERDGVMQAQR